MCFQITFLLCLVCSLSSVMTAENAANKTIVSIYYETYCPLSINFITKQFYPFYVSELYKNILPDFVPYGNATTTILPNGILSFTCEHGLKECYANKVHACVLNLPSSTATLLHKVKFINCTLATVDTNSSDYPMRECADLSGINSNAIKNCIDNGTEADILLETYGKRTRTFKNYGNVPFVALNAEFNEDNSAKLVKDFVGTYCSSVTFNDTTPDVCKSHKNAATTIDSFTLFPVLILLSTLLVSSYYHV